MIDFTINGIEASVEEGTTILDAAKKYNIHIPTLCHLKLHDLNVENASASCRVCMVEEEGKNKMIAACSTRVKKGMRIRTDSIRAIRTRRMMIELLLSDHPKDCLICPKNGKCELQNLAADAGIRSLRCEGERRVCTIDDDSFSIIRDMNKCILCKRCETMCNEVQTVGVLTDVGRGFHTVVGTVFDRPMHSTTCTFCGQCIAVCPTGALTEVDNTSDVWDAISSDKTVIVQTAPAVRVALGEEFGMEPGTVVMSMIQISLLMLL